jgi:hypothetical protein
MSPIASGAFAGSGSASWGAAIGRIAIATGGAAGALTAGAALIGTGRGTGFGISAGAAIGETVTCVPNSGDGCRALCSASALRRMPVISAAKTAQAALSTGRWDNGATTPADNRISLDVRFESAG